MASNRNASGAGRLTEAGSNEHRKSSADQPNRQERIAHLASLGFTPESMQAAAERVAALFKRESREALSRFLLGLLHLPLLEKHRPDPADDWGSLGRIDSGRWCVRCPGCGNTDQWTTITAPRCQGREGRFKCQYCPISTQNVIASFPAERVRAADKECYRLRSECAKWTPEQFAAEKARAEQVENVREFKREYRIQKNRGAR